LRWLGISCNSAAELGSVAQRCPQHLRLTTSAQTLDSLPPLPALSSLELRCRSHRQRHFEPEMLASMSNLRLLALEWTYDPADDRTVPEHITLRLPDRLTKLSLPRIETRMSRFPRFSIRGGSIEVLECHSYTLFLPPAELCANVRTLILEDEPGSDFVNRLGELEAKLPRLRTVVLRRFSVERLAELATVLPRIQLHPVDPGYRDPERWPRPR
jgi:hypothetical protein